jgi:short-chain Z-isoprenyl diphosphate synthase
MTFGNVVEGVYERWLRARLVNGPLPRHVAFIMDGNRRWAREMGHADPNLGHECGAAHAERVMRWCLAANIHHVTVFAASIDNLRKRSKTEVGLLMDLIERFANERVARRDVRVHLAGRIDELPAHTAIALKRCRDMSTDYPTENHLTMAIAYDGHTEILDAVRSILRAEAAAGRTLNEVAQTISVEDISAHLYTRGQPEPELVIRTGGDHRLSTFMPWQTANSHLHFCAAHWPAISQIEFLRALRAYAAATMAETS